MKFFTGPDIQTGGVVTYESCAAMIDEALGYAKAGDQQKALDCFDRLISLCAPQSEPWMAALTAGALFNKATVYRFAKDTINAVATFDQLVQQFENNEDIVLQQQVSKALYNKGIALQDAHQWTSAVDAFSAAVSNGRNATDSVIRERVARSMFAKAQCYNGLEQPSQAALALEQLVTTFGDAPEGVIQQHIGPAVLAIPRLLTKLPPAAHAASSAFNLAQEEGLRQELADAPEVLESYLEEHKKLIAKDVARAAESHAQAVAVLNDYGIRGKPFALFLRNFDLEASDKQIAVGEDVFVPISMSTSDYSDVENTVVGILNGRIRAIGISNPAGFRPDVTYQIPKLELRNEVWEYALHALLTLAALIVIKLEHLTPGVTLELDAVSKRKRADVAIVILPEDAHENEGNMGLERLAEFALAVPETQLQSPPIAARLEALISKALEPR
jgi:tetratricopeptide (TPR) repeat protein